MQELGHATLARQMWSTRQLYEVMVDFWANHLNVTNPFDGGWDVRTPYDNDVIRTHALGRFSDMLHRLGPAPGDDALPRQRRSSQKRSVNENYGRELLELHTVGPRRRIHRGRRAQQRVHHDRPHRDNDRRSSSTRPHRHWTGEVKVLDFTHPNGDAAEGLALGDAVPALPRHPPGHGQADRAQARPPVRLRRPAADAGRPARTVLSGQRHGHRAGAAHAVQLGRVLDVRPA